MFSSDISPALLELGWSPFFHQQLLSLNTAFHGFPAPERVASQQRSAYGLLGESGPRQAVLSGRLRHELSSHALPAVGDWILASPEGQIQHVFERSAAFLRHAVGSTSEAQCVAANVDLVVIVAALSTADADPHRVRHELSARRIERYLQAAALARVRAAVVLNKADLNPTFGDVASGLRAELGGSAEVLAASAASGAGMDDLIGLCRDKTTVLVGSSGVGKSSLTNRLLGRAVQEARPVRENDGRGRHTTTGRELFVLPTGGVLIDTPGMRELGLIADGELAPAGAFDDIEALGEGCRFSDCRHESEPGCAVRSAIEAGTLAPERWESARKLQRELEFQRGRVDARLRVEVRQRWKAQARQTRQRMAAKWRGDP